MRRLFGWDLPPGVTQRMIDEQVEGPEPEEECEHVWEEDEDHIEICGKCGIERGEKR